MSDGTEAGVIKHPLDFHYVTWFYFHMLKSDNSHKSLGTIHLYCIGIVILNFIMANG